MSGKNIASRPQWLIFFLSRIWDLLINFRGQNSWGKIKPFPTNMPDSLTFPQKICSEGIFLPSLDCFIWILQRLCLCPPPLRKYWMFGLWCSIVFGAILNAHNNNKKKKKGYNYKSCKIYKEKTFKKNWILTFLCCLWQRRLKMVIIYFFFLFVSTKNKKSFYPFGQRK